MYSKVSKLLLLFFLVNELVIKCHCKSYMSGQNVSMYTSEYLSTFDLSEVPTYIYTFIHFIYYLCIDLTAK